MTTPAAVSPSLLVVDDETGVREMLTMALEFVGFDVRSAATGSQALECATRYAPDLVLMDVNLPDLDGFEVCRMMRERGMAIPVMFLSARSGLDDRVRGLDLGGDDFVTKPFELKEVTARVRAILRRCDDGGRTAAKRRRFTVGDIRLDPDSHQVWAAEVPVHLTNTEFALLRYLMENPGRVLTRAQIQERVWNHQVDASGSVDTYIYYLRRKLGDQRQSPIRTVRGVGYLLCAD
ncbi:response regulator transcription factor [Streptomyces apocyni]|uniref:response regulator transcription factor n=1 Tax=Streptomyces apocyni TaxID=2654677 RepID=UPI0018D0A288|nr:response regulator transcription factor [Streptomyces apocyni]